MLSEMQYYRADIGIFEVLVGLFIVALLGLTRIISQTFKAARANPVDNLKIE